MAFENTRAELALLLAQVQDVPEDRHELYLRIMQKLSELKAYGMPLPQDLVELEQCLEGEFARELAADQRAAKRPVGSPRRDDGGGE
jgi:hypothetical protein